ncbi:CHAT domain-containing protein [Saccharothrix xinjiangensis]|uniref:CHAT domain-containing protein n=1 Tax=Saccharothrix xinjiangensis TaxID=204798 RepID=A0ABV9YDR9_9PSEU
MRDEIDSAGAAPARRALSPLAMGMVREAMDAPDRAMPFAAEPAEWLVSTTTLGNMVSVVEAAWDRLHPDDADLEAVYLAACYHYARARHLPEEERGWEVRAAISLFSVVHALRPRSVPEPLRTAFAADPPALVPPSEILHSVGLVLFFAVTRERDAAGLRRAAGLIGLALASEPLAGSKPVMLFNSGSVLLEQWKLDGDQGTLRKAVLFMREAVAAYPGHLTVPEHVLSTLRAAQSELPAPEVAGARQRVQQYLNSGIRDVARLDSIIHETRAELEALPADDDERHGHLSSLAVLLRVRFELTGDGNDVDRSIELLRQVLREAGDGQVRRMASSALALGCLHRYVERKDPADLEAATAAGRDSLAGVSPGSPEYPKALTNLAAVLLSRFLASEDLAELAEVIRYLEIAVATEPVGGNDYQVMRVKLGEALTLRGLRAGELADLATAAAVLRSVVDEPPAEGVNQQFARMGLGRLEVVWAKVSGNAGALRNAVEQFRATALAPSHDMRTRVQAAGSWGALSARLGDVEESSRAFGFALDELLPKFAGLFLDRASRESRLRQVTSLARDAAWAEIRCGRPEEALVRLEQGRGVLLAQALRLRGGQADLAAAAPALAERYERVCAALVQEPDTGERRRDLAAEFDDLVREIRGLPGFAGFAVPADWGRLRDAARGGPVVVVNVAELGCDVLVLQPGGVVEALPLVGATSAEVARRAEEFLAAVASMSDDVGDFESRYRGDLVIADTLGWLWDHVAGPALATLGPLPERVWWCPTGPLALLPLHAAHDRGNDTYVHDLVASSYTPTLNALVEARSAPPSADGGLVGVGVTGDPPLPGVREELTAVGRWTPAMTTLLDEAATPEAVLGALRAHGRVHLACHGVRDADDPSNSGLVLHGGVLTVRQLAGRRLRDAEFAFLSACHTAAGGRQLVDEVITLASALQLCGYRQVIGGLWPVQDGLMPALAGDVHRRLAERGTTADAALALHAATRRLREDPRYASPVFWASLTHIGP